MIRTGFGSEFFSFLFTLRSPLMMEGVINYSRLWCSFSSGSSSLYTLHFLLQSYSIFTFIFLHPLKICDSLPFFSDSLLFLLSASLAHPPTRPFFLSALTLGSKVSCLTVNVLSFPQREATRWQRENYSVLHCNNLHRVTHAHTHTYVLPPVSLSLAKHIASSSACV